MFRRLRSSTAPSMQHRPECEQGRGDEPDLPPSGSPEAEQVGRDDRNPVRSERDREPESECDVGVERQAQRPIGKDRDAPDERPADRRCARGAHAEHEEGRDRRHTPDGDEQHNRAIRRPDSPTVHTRPRARPTPPARRAAPSSAGPSSRAARASRSGSRTRRRGAGRTRTPGNQAGSMSRRLRGQPAGGRSGRGRETPGLRSHAYPDGLQSELEVPPLREGTASVSGSPHPQSDGRSVVGRVGAVTLRSKGRSEPQKTTKKAGRRSTVLST